MFWSSRLLTLIAIFLLSGKQELLMQLHNLSVIGLNCYKRNEMIYLISENHVCMCDASYCWSSLTEKCIHVGESFSSCSVVKMISCPFRELTSSP